jgi:hypothetical protein
MCGMVSHKKMFCKDALFICENEDFCEGRGDIFKQQTFYFPSILFLVKCTYVYIDIIPM